MDASYSQTKKLKVGEVSKENERKSFIINWILTSEKIMNNNGNDNGLSDKDGELSLQKQEHKDQINFQTPEDMDCFINSALGSNTTLYSEDCWTNHDSSVTGDLFFYGNCETSAFGSSSEPLLYTVEEYREASKRKRSSSLSPPLNTSFNVRALRDAEITNKKNYIQTLEENIVALKTVLHQTTKALKLCCSSSKDNFSLQHAECERLLLLSSCQFNEITKKLKRLKNEEESRFTLRIESGTVQVSNLFLHFKTAPSLHKDEKEVWFVCLLTQDEKVEASKVYPISRNQKTLEFDDQFTFINLQNDFTINIDIYSIQLKQSRKLHKQFFKRLDSGTLDTPNFESQDVWIAPNFQLEGSFNLVLEKLEPAVLGEFAEGNVIGCSLTWDVDSKVHLSGFLEITRDVEEYIVWDRKWCLLEGCLLKYWNYPSDRDTMPPLETIDLRRCVSSAVKPQDREQCSWRRTFMLEIIFPSSQDAGDMKIIKKFFRCDSSKELRDWYMVLNKHMKLLKKWKKASS